MDTIFSICLGIGLSAACGFRVFMPLMVMSVASITGDLTLSPEFAWIGTYPALGAFAVASFLEVSAYYIPWLDNMLDSVAVPAATVAGTIAMASSVSDMSPLLQWSLAVIVGGGTAGTIQGFTTLTRLASTTMTGGLGNPLVATIEAGGAVGMSILSISLPLIAAAAVIGILYFAVKKIVKRFFGEKEIKASPQKEAVSPYLN